MDYINIVKCVFTALLNNAPLVITAIIAFFTYKSAKEIEKNTSAQIIFYIRNQFDSNLIKKSMKIIKENENNLLNNDTLTKLIAENQKYLYNNGKTITLLDYMRIYYNLFEKIYVLLISECINKKIIKNVILPDEKYILLNIIEPATKDNSDFDQNIFTEFRRLLN